MRLAIATIYQRKFDCCDDTSETPWDGVNGKSDADKNAVIPFIRKALGLHKGHNIKPILKQVRTCWINKEKYEGHSSAWYGSRGRKVTIKEDSILAQIIADSVEDGDSITMAWLLVNEHLAESGEPYTA